MTLSWTSGIFFSKKSKMFHEFLRWKNKNKIYKILARRFQGTDTRTLELWYPCMWNLKFKAKIFPKLPSILFCSSEDKDNADDGKLETSIVDFLAADFLTVVKGLKYYFYLVFLRLVRALSNALDSFSVFLKTYKAELFAINFSQWLACSQLWPFCFHRDIDGMESQSFKSLRPSLSRKISAIVKGWEETSNFVRSLKNFD